MLFCWGDERIALEEFELNKCFSNLATFKTCAFQFLELLVREFWELMSTHLKIAKFWETLVSATPNSLWMRCNKLFWHKVEQNATLNLLIISGLFYAVFQTFPILNSKSKQTKTLVFFFPRDYFGKINLGLIIFFGYLCSQ